MESSALPCKKSQQLTRQGSYRWSESGTDHGVLSCNFLNSHPESTGAQNITSRRLPSYESGNGQYLKVYHVQYMYSW